MEMFTKLIIFLIVVYFIGKFLLRRFIKNSVRNFENATGVREVKEGTTVRCVKCGSYVASELSVKGRGLYFCSDECKEEYIKNGH